MRDALSLTDQAIAYGEGRWPGAEVSRDAGHGGPRQGAGFGIGDSG
jgi:hypothetical protein